MDIIFEAVRNLLPNSRSVGVVAPLGVRPASKGGLRTGPNAEIVHLPPDFLCPWADMVSEQWEILVLFLRFCWLAGFSIGRPRSRIELCYGVVLEQFHSGPQPSDNDRWPLFKRV
jgi:hypothetical protein